MAWNTIPEETCAVITEAIAARAWKKMLPVKEKWPFGTDRGCSGRATSGFNQV
jgi:hypothetical protein